MLNAFKTTRMKRGEFIGFAAMFAAFYKLPFTPTQNELFSFDNSLLQGLLKDMPAHQKETALLMVKNLLFDLDYILKQSNKRFLISEMINQK